MIGRCWCGSADVYGPGVDILERIIHDTIISQTILSYGDTYRYHKWDYHMETHTHIIITHIIFNIMLNSTRAHNVYIYIHMCVNTYVYTHRHMNIHICIDVYIYTYVYAQRHRHIHLDIYIYNIHIYILYICEIYIRRCTRWAGVEFTQRIHVHIHMCMQK